MKKIVFIISSLGGGGAERVSTILANHFCNAGYDVHAIIFKSEPKEYALNSNIKKYYPPQYRAKFYRVLKQVAFMNKELKQLKPDCVIALSMIKYLFLGRVTHNYKCIVSERNDPNSYKWTEQLIHKRVFRRASKVVFQTQEARDFYSSEVDSDRFALIPNPVKENLPSIFKGKREKRIVAFSRLTEQKNIPMLLKSFALFVEEYPDYILEIYGRGPLKDTLITLGRELKIDNKVTFIDFSESIHEDVLKAAMFVSSSDYEGISNSMIEAMAIGLPVICTDCPCGGARMFIDNQVNGLLIPVGGQMALVDAMKQFASNFNLANTCGENATKVRELLDSSSIAKRWVDVLEEIH